MFIHWGLDSILGQKLGRMGDGTFRSANEKLRAVFSGAAICGAGVGKLAREAGCVHCEDDQAPRGFLLISIPTHGLLSVERGAGRAWCRNSAAARAETACGLFPIHSLMTVASSGLADCHKDRRLEALWDLRHGAPARTQ